MWLCPQEVLTVRLLRASECQAPGRTHTPLTLRETSIAALPALQEKPSLVTFLFGLFALRGGHLSGEQSVGGSWGTPVHDVTQE